MDGRRAGTVPAPVPDKLSLKRHHTTEEDARGRGLAGTRAAHHVTVATPYGTAVSTGDFIIPPPGFAVADVQQAAQKADAIFYSVNPGGPSVRLNQIAMRAETGMEAMAEATGGTAFIPDGEKDLERVFRQVAAELRGQYLLQYYGTSEAPAGQFRRIQVTIPARADLRVRARQGYYPKKQQD